MLKVFTYSLTHVLTHSRTYSLTYLLTHSRTHSLTHIKVNPPAPFKYFGKTILEKTGTLAMSIALRQIENAFVQSLSKDYEKWAVDKEYREKRAGKPRSVTTKSDLPASIVTATDLPTPVTPIQPPSPSPAPSMPSSNVVVPEVVKAREISMEGLLYPMHTYSLTHSLTPLFTETIGSPFSLSDDVCLIPGEPIVRIEEAPLNSRRIFTGIDILAKVDDIWSVLTDYENLQEVVPSLVKNEVLERKENGGAVLLQVGGAKVYSLAPRTVNCLLTHLLQGPTRDYIHCEDCIRREHIPRK